jgi:hypothetical protein
MVGQVLQISVFNLKSQQTIQKKTISQLLFMDCVLLPLQHE